MHLDPSGTWLEAVRCIARSGGHLAHRPEDRTIHCHVRDGSKPACKQEIQASERLTLVRAWRGHEDDQHSNYG